ncbi:hypothetical protein KY289_023503 [Solanum tuberosum]|nr:hypothetical protein KY289_023503 [Solanum tuberosum]
MVATREFGIIWGGTPEYWEWLSDPNSRNVKAVVRFVDSESDDEAEQRVKVVPFLGLGPRGRLPLKRGDRWMELKMGNIFNDTGDVEARLIEFRHLGWKHGFIVQGLEFRPE